MDQDNFNFLQGEENVELKNSKDSEDENDKTDSSDNCRIVLTDLELFDFSEFKDFDEMRFENKDEAKERSLKRPFEKEDSDDDGIEAKRPLVVEDYDFLRDLRKYHKEHIDKKNVTIALKKFEKLSVGSSDEIKNDKTCLSYSNSKKDESDKNHTEIPRIMEKCRYWPLCRYGKECYYVHPSEDCKEFPFCENRQYCLKLHPLCKYDYYCTNPSCHYQHSCPLVEDTVGTVCRFSRYCTNDYCPFYHPK